MNGYKLFGIASVLAVVVLLVFATTYNLSAQGSNAGASYGTLNQAEFNAVSVEQPGHNVSVANSTVYINGTAVMPVMMGPMNLSSMYSFEMFGMINPVLVVKGGSSVHFQMINVDSDSYHNFVISSIQPPYQYNMMGEGMMSWGVNSTGFMTMMNYLQPMHTGTYEYANMTYNFGNPGTYWYLCTYPGHAQLGMYGKIVVT